MARSVEWALSQPGDLARIHVARALVLVGLLGAKMLGGWGVQWDIRWHLEIGRDWFWIAPHVMTYAAVTAGALLAFGVLLYHTLRAQRGAAVPGAIRVAGLSSTPGWHLAWWGMAVTIAAAPIDDLWHRMFGIDVTLWSPPHLLGFVGAQLNTLGAMLIALELWPAGRARVVALLVAGTLLLGVFYITVDPAVQTAFRRGGVFFFTWAVLGALFFTFTLTLLTRLTAWRSAPVILTLGALAFHFAGLGISDAGFALTQPVPAVAEAIAADPDSPIAIAHEMARRGGTRPGRAFWIRLFPILPAALMVLADSRRRWVAGALAFGLAQLAISSAQFARAPSLSHALPAATDVVPALVLAALAALAGGVAAAWLADRLQVLGNHARARPAP